MFGFNRKLGCHDQPESSQSSGKDHDGYRRSQKGHEERRTFYFGGELYHILYVSITKSVIIVICSQLHTVIVNNIYVLKVQMWYFLFQNPPTI